MTKEEFKKWCSEKLKYKGIKLLEYVDKHYEKYYGHYKEVKNNNGKMGITLLEIKPISALSLKELNEWYKISSNFYSKYGMSRFISIANNCFEVYLKQKNKKISNNLKQFKKELL